MTFYLNIFFHNLPSCKCALQRCLKLSDPGSTRRCLPNDRDGFKKNPKKCSDNKKLRQIKRKMRYDLKPPLIIFTQLSVDKVNSSNKTHKRYMIIFLLQWSYHLLPTRKALATQNCDTTFLRFNALGEEIKNKNKKVLKMIYFHR